VEQGETEERKEQRTLRLADSLQPVRTLSGFSGQAVSGSLATC
jgi:hypothetical protein